MNAENDPGFEYGRERVGYTGKCDWDDEVNVSSRRTEGTE